jgi:hypothetical protein
VTVHTGETPTLTGAEWREIHILLEITYNDRTEARTSPQKHMLVLKALGTAFDSTELEIYDNKNRKLSLEACKAMENIQHYESHFKLHQGNGRHYVIFRVSSTIRFQGIKRESDVLRNLKKTGCYMKRHHWSQDQWDIVTLGFLTEMDPGRHQPDEVRAQILELAKAKECETTPGSRFKLVPQRFKVRHNGTHCNADAFGVQCMRIDAQSVDTLMKNTYRDSLAYVKNRMRKENPKSYMSALRLQNKYITNVKTIPIVGITKITMADIRPHLLGNENIQYVAATKKSETIGRWDVLTDDKHNESVRKFISTNLEQWLEAATVDPETPEHYPPPGIATRTTTGRDESSHGDTMSYLSSSAGSYDSMMENDADEQQYNSAPPQRARNSVSVSGFSWAQVTARTTQAAASRVSQVSDLTTPTQVTQAQSVEMTALKTEVSDLKSQLKRFEDLIIALTERLPQTAAYHQHQQQPQYQPQFYNQSHQVTQQQQQQTPNATPPRNNFTAGRGHGGTQNGGRKPQDPRGRQIRNTGSSQKREVQSPPHGPADQTSTKRSDTKTTPIRRIDQALEVEERRMTVTNPYAQERRLSHHDPSQYTQRYSDSQGRPHGMDSQGRHTDGRMDELIYSASQQPRDQVQFEYPTPSQEEINMAYYTQHQNMQQYAEQEQANDRNDTSDPSHPAEDAMNYALL